MKKGRKVLGALFLTLSLVFSLSVPAFAAAVPNITDPGGGGNEIYVTIFAVSTGTASSSNTSGHSWLYIDNETPFSITVGVKSVAPGAGITLELGETEVLM